MRRYITVILWVASLFLLSSSLHAEDLRQEENFKNYLKKEILIHPTGAWFNVEKPITTYSSSLDIGKQKICDSKELTRASDIWKFLQEIGGITVKIPGKVVEGDWMGNNCEFTITSFDPTPLGKDLYIGKDGWHHLNLVHQKFLGFKSFGFIHGNCPIAGEVLLKNVELTNFAKNNRKLIEKAYQFQKIYNLEVIGKFCGMPLEDGTVRWETLDRLYQDP